MKNGSDDMSSEFVVNSVVKCYNNEQMNEKGSSSSDLPEAHKLILVPTDWNWGWKRQFPLGPRAGREFPQKQGLLEAGE